MIDALGARGELARTMIIFTSDNGYAWGEQRWFGKFLPYRSSVSVPAILRWPGRVAEGATDRRLFGLIDIAPTILRAAGIAPLASAPLDGTPLTAARTRGRILTDYPYDASNDGGPPGSWAATRASSYEYVETYDLDGAVVFREYYDLRADPWETRNLLADGDPANDPDVAALHTQLARDRRCVGAACP
jgi:arylsulfatase A-like enzyme